MRSAWHPCKHQYISHHHQRLPLRASASSRETFNDLAAEFGIYLKLNFASSNTIGRALYYQQPQSHGRDNPVQLISVPPNLCLFSPSPPLKHIHPLANAASRLPETMPWEIRIGAMLIWTLTSDQADRASQRFWSRYKPFLPSPSKLTSLLVYKTDELDLFDDDQLTAMATEWQKEVEDAYNLLTRSTGGLLFGLETTLEDFKWAVSVVESRAFGFRFKGEVVQALVPYFDQANHSFASKASHEFEEDTDRVVMIDGADAGRVEREFYITYGDKSNRQLQCQYGFIVTANPHAVLEDILRSKIVLPLPPIRRELAPKAADQIIEESLFLSGADALRLRTMARSISKSFGWRNAMQYKSITRDGERETILRLYSIADSDLALCRDFEIAPDCTCPLDLRRKTSASRYRIERQMCLEAVISISRVMLNSL